MNKNRISIGGDPRAFSEFNQLREEIGKLTHPARPDVDWQSVEQLSLVLFRHNGIELQTLAWYIIARMRHAGLAGLAEGAELLDALLVHHWAVLWPQQTHARIDVLSWLSARLQQELRTLTLTYDDLAQVYRVEQSLKNCGEVLQRLELKTLSKLESVTHWMHNAALRLETAEAQPDVALSALSVTARGISTIASSSGSVPLPMPPLVFVVNEPVVAPPANATRPRATWRSMLIGAMMGAAACAGVGWGVIAHLPQRFTVVQPLPAALTAEQLTALQHASSLNDKKDEALAATEQQLEAIHHLSPLWPREYAVALTQQLMVLWPQDERTQVLTDGLRKQWLNEALPEPSMQNWHLAQQGLEKLTAQLNTLDERKGKYLTGSELKSAIFTIRHQLDETPPAEELLRRIDEELKTQGRVSPAQYQQLDIRINQLLNRYMLVKQTANP